MPLPESTCAQPIFTKGLRKQRDWIATEQSKFFERNYGMSPLSSKLRSSWLSLPVVSLELSSPGLPDSIFLYALPPAFYLSSYVFYQHIPPPMSSTNISCPHHLSLPLESYFFLALLCREIYFPLTDLLVFLLNSISEPTHFHNQWLFKALLLSKRHFLLKRNFINRFWNKLLFPCYIEVYVIPRF